MSKNKDAWNTKENADAYDSYAANFPMYKDTSRDLVAISGIQPGMIVVDLAAGTGATTQAIIDKTHGDVRVIAVDQAEEMLKKVTEKFTARNVTSVTATAEELASVIPEKVDAVICNSAFWQMKPKETFDSVASILKEGGVFAFNLPDSFFPYKNFEKQPFRSTPYSTDDLIVWAKESGLALVSESVEAYKKELSEILAFSEIPVMKRNFASEKEKNAFLERMRAEDGAKRQWVYFVFKK